MPLLSVRGVKGAIYTFQLERPMLSDFSTDKMSDNAAPRPPRETAPADVNSGPGVSLGDGSRRTKMHTQAHLSTEELFNLARSYRMTPAERRAQRVSMIMGLRGSTSTLTYEKVEEVLDEVEGHEED